MTELRESTVTVAGDTCRVWTKGDGAPIGYLGGLGGVPRWLPFLDRLAESRQVIVPSLPGFPGAGAQHRSFIGLQDWLVAAADLLDRSGLTGADLVASSVGGLLAAELAAVSPATIGRLVFAAPMGTYDTDDPGLDPFAQPMDALAASQSANVAAWSEIFAPGEATPEAMLDWAMMLYRASDAAARLTWPFGDTGLVRRLYRVQQPTLVLWGAEDQILPPTYAKRFATALGGPTDTKIIEGAGHQLVVDQPDAAATAVLDFLGSVGNP